MAHLCDWGLARAVQAMYAVRMRSWIPLLLMIAVLVTSLEGAAEPVDDNAFHQTHHSHSDDASEWYPDHDGDDHDSDACEHFCHLHAIGLIGHVSLPELCPPHAFVPNRPTGNHRRATAPPTPPPNA